MKWLAWAIGTLALASIIHIATILAIPHIAPQDSWSRIVALAPKQGFHLLPRTRADAEALPLLDPAIIHGVCRFNLKDGPLMVSATLPDAYWSVAAHTRSGVIFFSVTGLSSPEGFIKIDLRNNLQRRETVLADAAAADSDEDDPILRIEAPEDEGFLLFRSLVPQASQHGTIEALAAKTQCQTVRAQ